jgi:hypothetical protein
MTRPGYPAVVVVALLCFTSLAGCYRYSPATPDALPSGAQVRARLSDEGVARLREITGNESREVEGQLISLDEDLFRLLIRMPSGNGNVFARDLKQRLVMSSDHIIALDVRELDQVKTAAALATTAAAITVVVVRAIIAGSGRPPGQLPREDGPSEGSVVSRVLLYSPRFLWTVMWD